MNQKTKQSRKYQVTINNPAEHGLTREIILDSGKVQQALSGLFLPV